MTTATAPLRPRVPPTPRARRLATRRRVIAWLRASFWFLASVSALSGIAFVLFIHRGDAEGSARIANREADLLLERGEVVERRLPLMQRYWWDHFRVTHGVLVATDRRLLFVGIPPGPLIPREPEPPELVELSFPYDRLLEVRRARVFLGTRAGMVLRTNEGTTTFALDALDRARADSIADVVRRRQGDLAAAADAERRATEVAVAASRRAIYHLVQRGEALEFIARRYGVPTDSLVKWNELQGTRINAGRRLLVKPGT